MSRGANPDRAQLPRPQRVFVALWPTPSVRRRLSEVGDDLARSATRARPVPAANLHLTLAFIGSLQADRVADLARSLDRVSTSAFDWVLDHVGHFDRAQVLWAGGPESLALSALATKVREQLDALAIAYDNKPFAPHVTLLRGVVRWSRRSSPIEPAIVWPCKGPTLVRSEQGAGGVTYIPDIGR